MWCQCSMENWLSTAQSEESGGYTITAVSSTVVVEKLQIKKYDYGIEPLKRTFFFLKEFEFNYVIVQSDNIHDPWNVQNANQQQCIVRIHVNLSMKMERILLFPLLFICNALNDCMISPLAIFSCVQYFRSSLSEN